MKKWMFPAGTVLALGAWLVAQNAATPKPLADVTPAGAVLYLEAKNFGALLGDWNASGEKKTWLASAKSTSVFAIPLVSALGTVLTKYARCDGPSAGHAAVELGGGRGNGAGDLRHQQPGVFVHHAAGRGASHAERVVERAHEVHGGRDRVLPEERRQAHRGIRHRRRYVAGGHSRRHALTGALVSIGGGNVATVRGEEWFQQADAAGAPGGECACTIDKLMRASAFRTYWIQRNRAELAQFRRAGRSAW